MSLRYRPWHYAVVTAIVDDVCWIGSHFGQPDDRSQRFVLGMENIDLQERALLERLLNGSRAVSGLRAMVGVEVLLDHDEPSQRDLILAINLRGLSPTQAVREYERRGALAYGRVVGSIDSQRMLTSWGLQGLFLHGIGFAS